MIMELQRICTDDQTLIDAFAESRIGGRSENQDSFGWKNTRLGYLVTVCDGMGGGPCGKTASSIAVNTIIAGVEEGSQNDDVAIIIKKTVEKANKAIFDAGNSQPSLKGMGSTAALLLVSEKSAFIAHVGDSRVYQLRGKKKVFRTFDHSMVFDMVSQGLLTEEQARLSAHSNVITRALGIKQDVKVDVVEVAYEKGDRFLLCSDGIHGALPEKKLVKMATRKKIGLDVLVSGIADYVDHEGNVLGGGHDNLTIAVVETKSSSIRKPVRSAGGKKKMIILLSALLGISLTFNIIQLCNSINKTLDYKVKKGKTTEQSELQKTIDYETIKNWPRRDSLRYSDIQ